jgi:hypothetical protein
LQQQGNRRRELRLIGQAGISAVQKYHIAHAQHLASRLGLASSHLGHRLACCGVRRGAAFHSLFTAR